jgi:iron complex outermembrane receptor protein
MVTNYILTDTSREVTMRSKPICHFIAGACICFSSTSPAVEITLQEVTVTGTREGQLKAETPATVDIIKADEIRAVRPTHPSQIMGQVPGVWVSVTGGEGHQTAIRQPLSTNPVYLYLEDGIPTRSTGFFNHNALFEINLPQAGGIEVSKGPGTALYGSDAIGGVINVLTRPAPLKPEAEVLGEMGESGWKRLLVTGGNTAGDDGWRADLNLTDTDGWRTHTAYDRQSGMLRWDRVLSDNATLKTIVTFSNINQETAGSSSISKNDYENNPTTNYTPISFRKVSAYRASAAYEKETGDTLLSVTPYYRNDDMDYIANWSLGYDPTLLNTNNQSFGLMAKFRKDFAPYRARIIVGVDLDRSPGAHLEKVISSTTTGSGYTKVYTSYTEGAKVYDYDVTYQGVSPYVHGEFSPSEKLRLTGGLRHDEIRYSYDNRLSDGATTTGGRYYYRPADTSVKFNHLSPKLGLTYAFNSSFNGFASANHTFRAPSEGQLFRPGAATAAAALVTNTTGLKPVRVDSYELGLRGKGEQGLAYEASLYRMEKRDDILSYKDPVTNATQAVNAGKTLHRGIELGAGMDIAREWRLDVAYSYAKHSYEQWVVNSTTDYSGKEMSTAPRSIANVRLSYAPAALNGGRMTMELVSLGSYWLDDANTAKYPGHDLLNLRVNYPVNKAIEVFGSINNLTDERYAENASLSSNNQVFSPGMPRTIYAGARYNW